MDLQKMYDLTGRLFDEDTDFFDESRMLSMKSGEVSEVALMNEKGFLDEEEYETSLLDDGVALMVIGMQMCHKAGAEMDDVSEEINERLAMVEDELDKYDVRIALRDAGQYAEFAKFTGQVPEVKVVTSERLDDLEEVMATMLLTKFTLERLDSEPTEQERERIEAGLDTLIDLKKDLPSDKSASEVDELIEDIQHFMNTGEGPKDSFVMVFETIYDTMFDMAVNLYVYEYHNLDGSDDKAYY